MALYHVVVYELVENPYTNSQDEEFLGEYVFDHEELLTEARIRNLFAKRGKVVSRVDIVRE